MALPPTNFELFSTKLLLVKVLNHEKVNMGFESYFNKDRIDLKYIKFILFTLTIDAGPLKFFLH